MPLFTFVLNMDSRRRPHPGTLADLQCPQPDFLELTPAETEGRHSMHTSGPSTQRLTQQVEHGAALYTHWVMHTWVSPPAESEELAKCCGIHLQAILSREYVEIVGQLCVHIGLTLPESVELAKCCHIHM